MKSTFTSHHLTVPFFNHIHVTQFCIGDSDSVIVSMSPLNCTSTYITSPTTTTANSASIIVHVICGVVSPVKVMSVGAFSSESLNCLQRSRVHPFSLPLPLPFVVFWNRVSGLWVSPLQWSHLFYALLTWDSATVFSYVLCVSQPTPNSENNVVSIFYCFNPSVFGWKAGGRMLVPMVWDNDGKLHTFAATFFCICNDCM